VGRVEDLCGRRREGAAAHPNEDHTFVVLQGKAKFYGPNHETRLIGNNEGVLLPHGTFYWFKATSDEPLVMVRIGAGAFDGVDRHGRINPDGSEMPGDSVENKQVWRRGQRRRPPRAL
jgi:mannose-6-phosphate isomerase-like protein (cupin superfamily)